MVNTQETWLLLITKNLICEVKYRKEKGFPSPFTVLDNRDIAVYKRGTDRKWVLIVPGELVEEMLNETT